MPDEPRFIWVVKNTQPTLVIISDLGQKGLYLRPNTEIALHELFPWHKLVESTGLRDAIQNDLIKVLDKRVLSPVTTGISSIEENQELKALKEQIALLQKSIDSKPNQTLIEQHTMDSESIKNDFKAEIANLKLSLEQSKNSEIPQIKSQEINSDDLSKQISDSVNAGLSTLLQSFQGIQLAEKEFKLDGYIEKRPEDVMTDDIVRSHKKISGSATAGSKQNIQEKVSDSDINDNADLLSQL